MFAVTRLLESAKQFIATFHHPESFLQLYIDAVHNRGFQVGALITKSFI